MPLEVGQIAPDFTLPDSHGTEVTLSELRGGPVVIWFYPKDKTPSCTKEACSFSEHNGAFEELGVATLGISKDSPKSHLGFIEKYGLRTRLLSDLDREVLKAYSAWGEKKLYGKIVLGTTRSTVLIDAEGRIAKLWPKVKVKGHVEEVLEAAKELLS